MLNKIEIPNQRQRAGKTTTAVNFAACFAKSRLPMLAVDIDTQANCTSNVGIDPEAVRPNAYRTLIKSKSDIRKNFVSNCFFPIYKNVRGIDASIKGVPVIELDRSCRASLDYFRLSHEVIHEC
jgi:chromosome partitioning protein